MPLDGVVGAHLLADLEAATCFGIITSSSTSAGRSRRIAASASSPSRATLHARSPRASSGTRARSGCSARRRRSGSCWLMRWSPGAAGRPVRRPGQLESEACAPARVRTRSHIRPPKCSTIWRLIGRPRPVPCGRFAASPPWRNFSKISACWSAARRGRCPAPRPVSAGSVGACSRSVDPPAARRQELGGVRQQVQQHLQSAGRRRRAASARDSGRSSTTAAPRSRNISAVVCTACSISSRRSTSVVVPFARGRIRSWPCPAPG